MVRFPLLWSARTARPGRVVDFCPVKTTRPRARSWGVRVTPTQHLGGNQPMVGPPPINVQKPGPVGRVSCEVFWHGVGIFRVSRCFSGFRDVSGDSGMFLATPGCYWDFGMFSGNPECEPACGTGCRCGNVERSCGMPRVDGEHARAAGNKRLGDVVSCLGQQSRHLE